MTILVTGASGLLGRGVAHALSTDGYNVRTLQRRPSGVPGVTDFLGSVTDEKLVEEAMAGVDTLVHMAAKVSVTGPWQEYVDININGTRTVLDAAERAGVERVVHISSPSVAHAGSSIVGERAGVADPVAARGEYARSKASGELDALSRDRADFRVLVLRPHLMWGPGDTQLTERVIDRSRAGRLPRIGTGAGLVDSLFIDNAIDAVIAAVRRVDAVHGESLVVTNGEPRPVGELIELIGRAAGAPAPKLRVPRALALAAGEVIERVWPLSGVDDEPPLTRFLVEQLSTAHWFDQRRTREALEWQPRVSIDEGLECIRVHYNSR